MAASKHLSKTWSNSLGGCCGLRVKRLKKGRKSNILILQYPTFVSQQPQSPRGNVLIPNTSCCRRAHFGSRRALRVILYPPILGLIISGSLANQRSISISICRASCNLSCNEMREWQIWTDICRMICAKSIIHGMMANSESSRGGMLRSWYSSIPRESGRPTEKLISLIDQHISPMAMYNVLTFPKRTNPCYLVRVMKLHRNTHF